MRNYLIKIVVMTGATIVFSACAQQSKLEMALNAAGTNHIELLKVIDHYRKNSNKDSLKLKATYFLIENMVDHGSIWNNAIDSFRNEIITSDSVLKKEQINDLWTKQNKDSKTVMKMDLRTLNASFLIENIDMAFKAWKEAPWKEEVDFETFCRYILPYRFEHELLANGWRYNLYNTYHPLVKDAKTAKEAFEIIYSEVGKRFVSQSSKFPYIIDVIAMQNQKEFSCMQRCVVVGAIMRALGIPVAIDNVGIWANYSHNSHAWVSLITKKGTYSIYKDEKESKMKNKIDATLFELKYDIGKDYPYDTTFQKRCSKILRGTFERHDRIDVFDNKVKLVQRLLDPYTIDVSQEYGLNGMVDIRPSESVDYIYLCTFMSGYDWIPICYSKVNNGIAHFDHIGDSILYLPMGIIDSKLKPMGNPFILLKNKTQSIRPNTQNTITITVDRKYPLTGKWLNEWASMVGGRFEGSNDASFSKCNILHTIARTPIFQNRIMVDNSHTYRYVRYVTECTTPIAEIDVYEENKKIMLTVGNSTIKHAERAIDNDTKTRTNAESGYLDFDMGIPHRISSIVYVPKNDDNFVVVGHNYELFYYNNGWKSLGKIQSKGYSIRFTKVPIGALLLLKDHTKGKEERPFLYKNGIQEWW